MRFLPLHLTKIALLIAPPHWFGIALKLFSSVTVCSHKFHIPLVCCICVQGKPLVAPPRRLLPSTHRAGLRRPAAAFPPIPPFPLPEAGRCGERPASFHGQCPWGRTARYARRALAGHAAWLRSYRRSATGLAARRSGAAPCRLYCIDRHSATGLMAR